MQRKDLLQEQIERWRGEAITLRRYGSVASATTLEACAEDLEACLSSVDETLLTLEQAAAESGYSIDHLGRLVREGKIPNAGRPGAPRIARQDLPRKATQVARARSLHQTSKRQVVLSIIDRGAA